ncbi:Chromosome-partitioning protein ParB [Nereida ignava]|uniref:Chromosome-partitioning protein ParB n=1 Tax=Nereida ignava TaxID=282199 RepID=A0A0U1NK84_9RHOB|nr:ParB/RepB/Spo0J family partition protein [Nereida ignava]CRK75154.1 Chromosome-partitioning protein ParB [Nereida ignava]SFI99832.1 chromosome partitioning protein, ParB family [Nereida ignava DSM 16309]
MSKSPNKGRGLGRGLSALMADVPTQSEAPSEDVVKSTTLVSIDLIFPNPNQPRKSFDEGDLDELASSLREKGIIQPLIVRPDTTGQKGAYQIVAGERRWRAAARAQIHEVPVIVRDFNDTEVLELGIIENIQRADLNAVEEALAYNQLIQRHGHTQDAVAKAMGKSRSHITNLLRLLTLPDDVQDKVVTGALSMGHARAMISADNPSNIAQTVIAKGLSVRQTEELVKSGSNKGKSGGSSGGRSDGSSDKDADTRALEGELSAQLRMGVSISHNPGNDGGQIVIKYKDLEQLDDLCRLLAG